MAKWRNRTCKCGKVDFTASKSAACKECFLAETRSARIADEREKIMSIYGNVEGPVVGDFNKRLYTFIHSCGREQTWRYDNLLKQLKVGPEPCITCGGKARQKKAMAGYVAKFQLSKRARTDLCAYTRKARGLSEKTYRDNIDLINPLRHPRMLGNQGWHLDHVISIVECFKRGWPPEKAAEVENLQMLLAGDNLAKGRTSARL